MINVRADKEFDLNFQVNIEGSEETPQVRFVFEMANGVHISFPGVRRDDSKVEVSLPSLNSIGLFEQTDEIPAKLEVIIEGNYFTPWSDVVSIEQPISISAETIPNNTQIQEAAMTVENAPTVHYKDHEKFSPVEKLKKIRKDQSGIFTEEVVNGIIHRKYKSMKK